MTRQVAFHQLLVRKLLLYGHRHPGESPSDMERVTHQSGKGSMNCFGVAAACGDAAQV